MNSKGLVLLLLPVMASSFRLCSLYGGCDPAPYSESAGGRSTSWLTIMSCTANQVPKLPSDFSKPVYQYLFEVFSKNTHLLPLGVPMHSQSEDFKTTAEYEKCLWGGGVKDIRRNDIAQDINMANDALNDIEPETKAEESAYHTLFASRQGGYDSLTGFSLLGGKIVAALVGYIIYTLTG